MKFKDLNKDEFKKKWSEKTVSAMAETYKVSKQTIYVWGQKLCLGNREHDYRNGDSFEEYNKKIRTIFFMLFLYTEYKVVLLSLKQRPRRSRFPSLAHTSSNPFGVRS